VRAPKYSSDLNPIEQVFAKLKHLPRKACIRSVDALWAAIGQLLSAFTPTPCANTSKAQDTPHLKFIPL
jgi:transposase